MSDSSTMRDQTVQDFPINDEMLLTLIEYGFEFEKASFALCATENNFEEAIALLSDQN